MSEFERIDRILQRKLSELKEGQNVIWHGQDHFSAGGYIPLPRYILYDLKLSDAAVRGYAMLLHSAGVNKLTWPGQQAIADMRGCSPRKVQSFFAELRNRGHIHTIRQYGQINDIIAFDVTLREALGKEVKLPSHVEHLADDHPQLFVRPKNADLFTVGGWVNIPIAVLLDQKLSDGEFRVFSCLKSASFDRGQSSKVLQKTIASQLGCDVSKIKRAVSALKGKSYVQATKYGVGASNTYDFNFDADPKNIHNNR